MGNILEVSFERRQETNIVFCLGMIFVQVGAPIFNRVIDVAVHLQYGSYFGYF